MDTYHDWLITAKLISATANRQNSYGKALLNTILGRISVNGRPLYVDQNVIHISITTYVQAENTTDHTVISSSHTLEKDLPSTLRGDALAGRIDMVINESVIEAAKEVFGKMGFSDN